MVFDYMSNTLKWSESDYESRIFNTIDFTDEICDRYNQISVDDHGSVEQPLELKDEPKSTNDFIVMKYPRSMKYQLDNDELFEFIGFSKIDDGIIYKVNVPRGTTVESTDYYL
jgi:hypothetical protein